MDPIQPPFRIGRVEDGRVVDPFSEDDSTTSAGGFPGGTWVRVGPNGPEVLAGPGSARARLWSLAAERELRVYYPDAALAESARWQNTPGHRRPVPRRPDPSALRQHRRAPFEGSRPGDLRRARGNVGSRRLDGVVRHRRRRPLRATRLGALRRIAAPRLDLLPAGPRLPYAAARSVGRPGVDQSARRTAGAGLPRRGGAGRRGALLDHRAGAGPFTLQDFVPGGAGVLRRWRRADGRGGPGG